MFLDDHAFFPCSFSLIFKTLEAIGLKAKEKKNSAYRKDEQSVLINNSSWKMTFSCERRSFSRSCTCRSTFACFHAFSWLIKNRRFPSPDDIFFVRVIHQLATSIRTRKSRAKHSLIKYFAMKLIRNQFIKRYFHRSRNVSSNQS